MLLILIQLLTNQGQFLCQNIICICKHVIACSAIMVRSEQVGIALERQEKLRVKGLKPFLQ